MTVVEELIEDALKQPIDDSDNFTQRVEVLSQGLSRLMGVAVLHDMEMNYRAGQSFHVFLEKNGKLIDIQDNPVFDIETLVSSRGPLFVFEIKKSRAQGKIGENWSGQKEQWDFIASKLDLDCVKTTMNRISQFMEQNGYYRITGPELRRPYENFKRELDGKPATLYEILFAEI